MTLALCWIGCWIAWEGWSVLNSTFSCKIFVIISNNTDISQCFYFAHIYFAILLFCSHMPPMVFTLQQMHGMPMGAHPSLPLGPHPGAIPASAVPPGLIPRMPPSSLHIKEEKGTAPFAPICRLQLIATLFICQTFSDLGWKRSAGNNLPFAVDCRNWSWADSYKAMTVFCN